MLVDPKTQADWAENCARERANTFQQRRADTLTREEILRRCEERTTQKHEDVRRANEAKEAKEADDAKERVQKKIEDDR